MKLEEFYRRTGLINLSFKKLQSRRWNHKCEGIRELSQMNVQEAFNDIQKCIRYNHSTLTLEALIGVIQLKGLEGLNVLHDFNEPINDWVQLNILYEIKNASHTSETNFSDFLSSTNESVVVLGLRLIEVFNQNQNADLIREMLESNNSQSIKNQARKTLSKLSSLNYS